MKEIKIKYFYKGEEISIEDFRELEKTFTSPLPCKQETKEDVLYVYLQEPFDKYLADETLLFPRCQKPATENWTFLKNNTVKKEGVKYNESKPKLSLLFIQFPDALKAIIQCSEYGHEKYKEFDKDFLNFKRVEGGSAAYADASLRHRTETGLDKESRLPHQYHVAWNALAELQMWIEEQEFKTEK